jgi:NAD(P)-dependent dehydrogenase (short-subunit alcohol dehydrogenase family)
MNILITGATSGIGRHAALHLARKGHRVFATGRKQDALDTLGREAAGLKLETLQLDVTSAESIARAREAVDARTSGHGLDVLVNNAGYGTAGPTELITDADVRAQYETNVFGVMAMIRAFTPAMRERGNGRIINVSSIGGRLTFPFFGVYNSTKYAVESLSDALRAELQPFGVHVSLIEPGVIETGFADRSMIEVSKYKTSDSPYAFALSRTDELRKMADKQAVSPQCISDAIEAAATVRRPRARYVAPMRARLMLGFLGTLPTRWVDAIMRALTGLTRKRLRAAATPLIAKESAAS